MYEINDYCCEKIVNTNCFWDGEFHNLQSIKEQILRLSTKWTDLYASDILIFFEFFDRYFLEDGITEIDLYFCQNGIKWAMLFPDETEKYCSSVPDRYRGRAKFVFNDKNMTLYWENGNC